MARRLNDISTGGVVPGIELAVADVFCDTRQLIEMQEGRIDGTIYGRRGSPTQHPAEGKIAELENAENALIFCSGMAAISTTLSALVSNGQHVILTDEGNVTIRGYFSEVLPKSGIEVTTVPIDDMQNLGKYIKDNSALIFSEFPTNPFLRVIDLNHLVSVAREREIKTVIDSTFASPLNINPLGYGIDLVLHSATKYLGGHHDLSAGTVAGNEDLISKIEKYRNMQGTNIHPFASFLLDRSLSTFVLTMSYRNTAALEIAQYLEKHPKVDKVWYPGLASHPDYELAKRQMYGFGGVVTFTINATEEETGRFVDALTIPYLAHNFGGCTSTIEQHVLFTHYDKREEARKRGMDGNLLRYSVGLEEDTKAVIADFENVFREI